MIIIDLYKSVNGLYFGDGQDKAISLFGCPDEKNINFKGTVELFYDGFILRFDSEAREFRECTLLPGCNARVNGVDVEWGSGFFSWFLMQDNELKGIYEFIVSIKLGLALSGFHDGDCSQRAVHVFRRGEWDRFSGDLKPFKF